MSGTVSSEVHRERSELAARLKRQIGENLSHLLAESELDVEQLRPFVGRGASKIREVLDGSVNITLRTLARFSMAVGAVPLPSGGRQERGVPLPGEYARVRKAYFRFMEGKSIGPDLSGHILQSMVEDPEIAGASLGHLLILSFSRNLLWLRSSLDRTQEEIATVSGEQPSAISRLENGRHNATVETIAGVSHALGAVPSFLPISKRREAQLGRSFAMEFAPSLDRVSG